MIGAWAALLADVNWEGWRSGALRGALIGAGVGAAIGLVVWLVRKSRGGDGPG
jgi:hypothetical protein